MHKDCSSATLASLDREVLIAIFSLLDPVSLATVSCTNRDLRSLSSSAVLWTTLCKSRWQNLNTPCLVRRTESTKLSEEESKQRTTPVAVTNNSHSLADLHTLYAINNCWGGFPVTEIEGHRTCLRENCFADFCVSTAAAADMWPNSHAGGDIVYTLGSTLSMWSTGDCTQAGKMVRSHPIQDIELCCSITELAIGLVAVGHHDGAIDTYNLLPEDLSKETSCQWDTGSSDPIVDMQYCPSQKLLYGLCDPEHGGRSSLQKFDAITGQCIASAHEFMEKWGLTCFCITDQDGAGSEVVAGAANTEVCNSCTNSGMPSLCCHRSNAKAAALCVFDTRAGLEMVQRYSIHHRSLYPIMTCARGNFLFTSHVGAPLAVWDKRQMSHAVYEEEYLGNFPKTETFTDAEVPLPLPDRAADHQGLYLSTDGDQLVGRADNGISC
ncbi:TPA: hypothetical protein ACH3X1_011694 [Trebouxia sp. C0004]